MNVLKSAALWIMVLVVIVLLFMVINEGDNPREIGVVKLVRDYVRTDKIKDAKIEDVDYKLSGVLLTDSGEEPFTSQYLPGQAEWFITQMDEAGIDYTGEQSNNFFQMYLLPFLLPVIIILAFWFFLMRSIQSGGNKAISFGKSRAKLVNQGQTNTTFDDVAGVNEAKEELQEIVEFLKDPQKFSRLGAKIPKGVLLHGPPGTGKTLLAKAVAGEANVPFFSISGSDFVEMFVGVGASRVRDLFEQGKKHKPCLIFMDEIDAVGRQRFAGVGGGHDEREQTLNQLLVEMDGFNANEGIILIAATNRADVLDKALLRPGRFDRRIMVTYPDIQGREKILGVHMRKIKHDSAVDLNTLAKATTGFSGADLANMINEAALLAARNNMDQVTMAELEEAKDRVIMGPERRSIKQIQRDKEITAYHEAGHALCAKYLEDTHPVHKVTIIPRGMAMGVTSFLPEEHLSSSSRGRLRNELVTLLGGRAAEEVHFSEFTAGAANDISRVTHLAHRMVCELGMSDSLGPRSFGESSGGNVFLGRDMVRERDYSDLTASKIDEEVGKLVREAHDMAIQILTEHKDVLESVSEALLARETLTSEDLDLLIEGKELPPAEKQAARSGPTQDQLHPEEPLVEPPPVPGIPKLQPGDMGAS